jgi:hypothetical protein
MRGKTETTTKKGKYRRNRRKEKKRKKQKIIKKEKLKMNNKGVSIQRRTCTSAKSFATNLTQTGLGKNSSLCGDGRATNP